MADLEKTINKIETCIGSGVCSLCGYWEKGSDPCNCVNDLLADALALLKAQVPRVMTLEEIDEASVAWMEGDDEEIFPVLIVEAYADNKVGFLSTGDDLEWRQDTEKYNKRADFGWRCWTAKPTEEQRKETVWE